MRDDVFFAAVEDIQNLETIQSGLRVLKSLRRKYNLEHVVYHAQHSPDREGNRPLLVLTYPESWIKHYTSENYFAFDPVVRRGFASAIPLDWDTLDQKAPYTKKMFGEAAEAGLGKHGMSFPIRSANGSPALVSITSNAGDREWKEDKILIARDFQILAHYMHGKFNKLFGIVQDYKIRLAPREIEVLQWAAEGKTNDDIATILNLSERTVRLYLDTARHKMNCLNKTHAVAKAMSLGMICYTEKRH